MESWECIKCHNVYAPNVPFCLYCWFQNKDNLNITTQFKQQQQEEEQENKLNIKNIEIKKEISELNTLENKNLFIEQINIEIPTLNKQPNYPQSNKYPDTKIFLGGIGHAKERAIARKFKIPYILDSIIDLPIQPSKLVRSYFDYIKNNQIEYLLDSGAFSYMNNPKKSLILEDHIKQYCYYINEFDIKNFFELDLDIFLSLDEIENIRRKIYLETHKKPIVVYHESRGHEYWINMCKDNDYIAIGGLVNQPEINTPTRQKILLDMCDEAHLYNTQVHGLGFTPLTLLNNHTMFFDTVDSTSWNFTKRGNSATINEKGELIKIPPITTFTSVEGQEEDLRVWAEFSANYKGGVRL